MEFFFSHHFKYPLHPLWLHGFRGEVKVILICALHRRGAFLFWLTLGFFFMFDFLYLKIICLSKVEGFLLGVPCTFWICGLMSDINLGKFSVIIISNIPSVPFSFLLWSSHFNQTVPLVVVPQFLDILSLFFFPLFFSVCFSVLEKSYWEILKLRDSFLSCAQSTKFIKSIPNFRFTVFLILSISFWFFRWISTSLPAFPICSYKLSVLFTGTLSLLIIVVLNSRSDHFNISAIPEIDSDFLPFSMSYVFFSIATHDVLDERNCYKQTFSSVVKCGERRSSLQPCDLVAVFQWAFGSEFWTSHTRLSFSHHFGKAELSVWVGIGYFLSLKPARLW